VAWRGHRVEPATSTGDLDEAIVALAQYGETVIKTSVSDEDTKMLQEALQPAQIVRGDEAPRRVSFLSGSDVGFAAGAWRHGPRIERVRFARYLRCAPGVEVT
jgi:hypothetical protein